MTDGRGRGTRIRYGVQSQAGVPSTPMAQPRFTDPIEPMILGNMRANGLRSLAVQFEAEEVAP